MIETKAVSIHTYEVFAKMHTLIFLLMFVVHSFAATSEENDLSFVLQAETVSTHTVFHDRSFVMEYTTVNSDLEVAIHPTAATKPQASDEHAATVEFTSKIISQTAIETELPAFQELVSTYVSPTSPILRESQGGHLPMLVSHTSESFVVVTESPTNAEFSPTSESPTAEGQSITTEFNSVHSITNSDIIATFSELISDIRNPITATTTAPEFATFAKTDNMHTTVELLENHVATGALKTSDSIDHTNRPVSATPIPFTDAFPSMTEPKMLLSNHMKPQSTTLTTEFSARSDVSRDAITSMLQGLTSTKSNFLSKATSMEPQSTTALKRSTKVTTKSLVTFMSTLASLETSTTTAELTASLGPGLLSAVLPITIRNATEFLIPSQTISKFTALEPHTTSIFIPSKSTGSIILTTMVPRLQANSIKSSSALESTLKRLTTETLRVTMSPDSQKSQTSMQSSGLKYNITPEPQSPTSTTSMSSSSLHERVHLITTNSANDLATSRAYSITSESVSLSNIQGTSLPSPVVTDQRLTMSIQPSPSNSFHISTVIQTKGTLDFNLVISSTEMHKDMPTSSTQPTSSTVIVMVNNIKPTSTSKDSTSNLRLESLDNSQELHTTEQVTTEFQGILSSMTKIVRVSMGRESQTTSAIQYNFKMQSPSKSETLSPYFLKPSITTPSHITTSHNISSTNHLRFSVLPSVDTDSFITSLHTTEFQSSSQSRTTRLLMTTGILSAADQPTVTNIPIGMEHLPTPSSGSSNTYLKVPSIEPATSIKSTRITTESPSTPDNPTIQFPNTVIELPASVTGLNHTITTLFEVQKMSSTTTNKMPPNTAPASTTEVLTLRTNTATIAGDQLFNNMSVSASVTSSTSPAQSSSSSKIKRVTISTTLSATMNSKSPLLLITSSTMPMLSETNEYSTLSESLSVTAFPTTKESTLSTTEMLSEAIPLRSTSYQQAMTVTREIKSIKPPPTTYLQEDTVTSTVHRNITDYSTDHYPSHLEVTPTNTRLPSTFAVTDTLESQTLQLPESSTETSPRVNILPTITKLPQSTTSESDTLTIKSISELLTPTKHFSNSASLTSEGLYTTTVDVRTPFIAVSSDIAMTVEPPSVSTKYISVAMSAINLSMSSQSSTTLAATPEYQSHSRFRRSHSLPSSSIGGQILSSDYTEMSDHRNIVSLTITETEPTAIDSSYTSDYLLITESDLQIVNTRSILQVTLRPTPTVTPYPKVTPLLPPLDSILETSTTSLSVTKYQTVVNSKATTASFQFKQAITTPRSLSSVNAESVIATTQQSEYLQATVSQSAMEPITPNNSTNILRISTITTSITSEFDDLMTVELTSISESHLTTRLPTIVPSMSFESYRSAESSTLQATSRTELFSAVESYQPHMTEISSMVTPTTTGSEFDDIMTVEPTSISKSHLTTRLPTIVPSMSFESYRSAESSTLQATSRTEFFSAVESYQPHMTEISSMVTPTTTGSEFDDIMTVEPTSITKSHLTTRLPTTVPSMSFESYRSAESSTLQATSRTEFFSAVESYQPHMTEISSMVTPTTTGSEFDDIMTVEPTSITKSHLTTRLPTIVPSMSFESYRSAESSTLQATSRTEFFSAVESQTTQVFTNTREYSEPFSTAEIINHQMTTATQQQPTIAKLPFPSITTDLMLKPTGLVSAGHLKSTVTSVVETISSILEVLHPSTTVSENVAASGLPSSSHSPQKPELSHTALLFSATYQPHMTEISSMVTPTTTGPGELPSATDTLSLTTTNINDYHTKGPDREHVTNTELLQLLTAEPPVTTPTSPHSMFTIKHSLSTKKHHLTSENILITPSVTLEAQDIMSDSLPLSMTEYHNSFTVSRNLMSQIIVDTVSTTGLKPHIITSTTPVIQSMKPSHVAISSVTTSQSVLATDVHSQIFYLPSATVVRPTTAISYELSPDVTESTTAAPENSITLVSSTSETFVRSNIPVSKPAVTVILTTSESESINLEQIKPTSMESLAIAMSHTGMMELAMTNSPNIIEPSIVTNSVISTSVTKLPASTVKFTLSEILDTTPTDILSTTNLLLTPSTTLPSAFELVASIQSKTGARTEQNFPSSIQVSSTERNNVSVTTNVFPILINQSTTKPVESLSSLSIAPPTKSIASPTIVSHRFLSLTTEEYQHTIEPTSASILYSTPLSIAGSQDVADSLDTGLSRTTGNLASTNYGTILVPRLTQTPFTVITDLTQTASITNITSSSEVQHYPTSVQSPMITESEILNNTDFQTSLSMTIFEEPVSTAKPSDAKSYTNTESTAVTIVHTLLPSLTAYPTVTEIFPTSTSSETSMVPNISDSHSQISVTADPTSVQSPIVMESDTLDVSDSMEALSATITGKLVSTEKPSVTILYTNTESTKVRDSYTLLPSLRAYPTMTEILSTSTSSGITMVPKITESPGHFSVITDPTDTTSLVITTLSTKMLYYTTLVQSPMVTESDIPNVTDFQTSTEALSTTVLNELASTKSTVSHTLLPPLRASPEVLSTTITGEIVSTKLYMNTESTTVTVSHVLQSSLSASPIFTDSEILPTSISSATFMVLKKTESLSQFSAIIDPTDTTSLVIITTSKEMPYTTSVQSPIVTESDITDFQTSTEALSTTVQDELASTKSTVSHTLRASPTVTEIYPTSRYGTSLVPKLTYTTGQLSVVADTSSLASIKEVPYTTSVQYPMVIESDITDSMEVTITGELVSTATPSVTELYTNTESTTVTVSHMLLPSLRASPVIVNSEIFPTSTSFGITMVPKITESPGHFSVITDPTDTTSLVIITPSKEMPYTTSVQSPIVTESDIPNITDFQTSTEALSTTVLDELASTKSTVSHTLLPPLRASPTVTEIYPTSTSGTILVPKLTYTTGQLSVVADTSSLASIKEVPYTTSVQYPMVIESDITDSMEVTITGELVSTATPSVTELYTNTESTTVTVSHVLLPSLRASPVIVNSEIFPTSTSFGITMVPKITESPGHFSDITDPTDTTSLVIITPSNKMPYTTSLQSPIVTESDIPNITDFQTSTEALSTTVLDELASTKSTVSHTLQPPLRASPTVTEMYPTSTSGTILIPKLTDTPGQFSVVADTPSLAFITEVPYTTSIQSLMVESKLSDTTDFTKSTVSHTLLQSIRASPTVTEIFPTIRAFRTILVPRLTETPLSLVTDPTHTASIVSIISSTEVPHYPTTVQSPIISESGIPNITDLQTSTVTDTPLFTAEDSMLTPFTDDLKTNAIESSNTILPAYSTMETLYISVNLTHTLSPTKPSTMDIEFPCTSTAQPVITKVIPTTFESQKSMGMFTTTVSDKESYTSQPSAVGVYTTPTVLVSQFLSSATEDTVLFTTAPSISSTFTAIFSMATASEEYLYTTVLQTKDSSIPSAYTASLEHITESLSVVNIMTADIVFSPTATVRHPAITAVIQTSSELQTSMNMFSATVSDKEFYTSQPTVTGLYSQFESSTSNMSQILPTLAQRPLNTLSSTIAHSLFPTHTDSFTMSRASEEYLGTTKQETKDSSDTVSYTASLDSLTVVTLMSGSISHTSPHKVISTTAMISQNTADLPSVTKASYSNYLSITNLNTSPELSAKEFPTSIPGPTGTVAMVQDTTYVAVDSIPVPSFTTFSIVSELPTITGRSVTETNIPNFTKLQTSISTTTLEKATSTAQLSTINDSTNVKSPKSRIFQTQLFPSLTVHVEGSTVTDNVLITPTPTGSLIMEVSKIYSSSETPDSMVSHIPSLTITTDSEVATDSTTVQFQSTITPLIDPISATAMNTKSLTVAPSMIADTHSYTTTYAEDKLSTTASTTILSSLAPSE